MVNGLTERRFEIIEVNFGKMPKSSEILFPLTDVTSAPFLTYLDVNRRDCSFSQDLTCSLYDAAKNAFKLFPRFVLTGFPTAVGSWTWCVLSTWVLAPDCWLLFELLLADVLPPPRVHLDGCRLAKNPDLPFPLLAWGCGFPAEELLCPCPPTKQSKFCVEWRS